MAEDNLGDQMADDKCQICLGLLEKSVIAVSACTDCDLRMCSKCQTEHARQPEYSSHDTVPFPMLAIKVNCHRHGNRNATHWCLTCDLKPVCNMCLIGEHGGHETDAIKDAISQLNEKRKTVQHNKQELVENRNKISESISSLKREFDENLENVSNDLQADDMKIDKINTWLQEIHVPQFLPSLASCNEIRSLIEQGDALAKETCSAIKKPTSHVFGVRKLSKVADIVKNSIFKVKKKCFYLNAMLLVLCFSLYIIYLYLPGKESEIAIKIIDDVDSHPYARDKYDEWEIDVRGLGKVVDIKFISPDTLCVVKSRSITLYSCGMSSWDCWGKTYRKTFTDRSVTGVAAASNKIYITQYYNGKGKVQKYHPYKSSFISDSDIWPDEFDILNGIAVSPAGTVAIAERSRDTKQANVYLNHADGRRITMLGSGASDLFGSSTGDGTKTIFLTWEVNERLVVSDNKRHCIYVFDNNTGHVITTIGTPGQPGNDDNQLNIPQYLIVDHQNHILVADSGNNRLSEFDMDGNFLSHPLADKLHSVEYAAFIDIVKQGDTMMLLVGNTSGNVKIFRI